MGDTKERILNTALSLFARDGYEAVSVSEIAQALGMTKGALYKHYKSKRDLFDTMIRRMAELDGSAAAQYGMPEHILLADDSGYDRVDWTMLRQFALAQYRFWTEDPFARDIRRMLTLEQHRNGEMNRLYQDMLVSGPVRYLADIFRTMMENGRMRAGNAEALALAFYAPMFLLIGMSDDAAKGPCSLSALEQQIDDFTARWKI